MWWPVVVLLVVLLVALFVWLRDQIEVNRRNHRTLVELVNKLDVSSEVASTLLRSDREQVDRLVSMMSQIETRLIEHTVRLVDAAALARGVATDLESSHRRAEETSGNVAGEAADAAMVRENGRS